MTLRARYPLAALVLFLAAPLVAGDVHSVFTSGTSWYGRETSATTENWVGPDKEYHKKTYEISIVRRDLGVRWSLNPADKTYVEYPLAGKPPAKPGAKPARAAAAPESAAEKEKEDLRFVGLLSTSEPDFEWSDRELGGTEAVAGIPCRLFLVRGDADFASIEIRLGIAPEAAGTMPPPAEFQDVFRRDREALERVEKVMAGFPKGALLKMSLAADPPIGDIRKASLELEVFEEKAAPAGIYDLPAGYKKVERKEK